MAFFPALQGASRIVFVIAAGIPLSVAAYSAHAASGCAAGSRCLPVDTHGKPAAEPAPFVAQCTGKFPDFLAPSNYLTGPYSGPWFALSQNYPDVAPADTYPWLSIKFDQADDYLYALRTYAFEGMIDADFVPQKNSVRPWFHMPLMNNGPGRREPIRGLTEERVVPGPELGVKPKPHPGIHNYAVGFYNAAGATAIAKAWKNSVPDISTVQFPEGSMSFKILFSAGQPADFLDPSSDPMTGAPEFKIMTNAGVTTVRLLQMDVAAVDNNSPTGWVFGTFAYDKTATDPVAWNRLRPVGMSWGNDFGYTPADEAANKPLTESRISSQVPPYAKNHLGWAGRPNGPVDNPISGCLSCHGTSEFPIAADLAPFSKFCDNDDKKMYWFRTFKGDQPFGAVDSETCLPVTPVAQLKPLDFSLQMKVAVQNVLQFKLVNSCDPAAPTPLDAEDKSANPYADAPAVSR